MSRLSSVRRAFNPGVLSGITLGQWTRLLYANRMAVEPRYWPRALTISGLSVANSVLGRWEKWRYRRRWASLDVPPPVVVLGIARGGTTLLHNLLCADQRFAYLSLFASRFPRIFLSSARLGRALLSGRIDGSRIQDDVPLSLDAPAEDEPALCGLCLHSSLLSVVFPRRLDRYDRFRRSAGYTTEEARRWKGALRELLQKLTWRHRRPLVLKSPAHTARLRLLLDVVPDAKFVFIHRNPSEVVRSMIDTYRTVPPFWQLQTPGPRGEDWCTTLACTWMKGYFEERSLIAIGHLCEVGYEELVDAPVSTMRRVYDSLGLPDFSTVEPTLQAYVGATITPRPVRQFVLSPASQVTITGECPRWIEEWGYPPVSR